LVDIAVGDLGAADLLDLLPGHAKVGADGDRAVLVEQRVDGECAQGGRSRVEVRGQGADLGSEQGDGKPATERLGGDTRRSTVAP
jgi:hypothetical protein